MAQNDKPDTKNATRKPSASRPGRKAAKSAASEAVEAQQIDKAVKKPTAAKRASKAVVAQQSDKAKAASEKPAAKPRSRTAGGQVADKKAAAKASEKVVGSGEVARKSPASNAAVDEGKKTRVRRKASKPVEPAPNDDVVPPDDPFMGCTPREARFIDLWLACLNGTKAYKMAGFNPSSDQVAAVCASQLLRKPKVQAYLAHRRKEFYSKTEEQRDRLLGTILEASFADPRELSRYEYRACRYCWDEQHRYQYTPAELARAKAKYESDKSAFLILNPGASYPEFDEQGGATYDGRRDPNPDCPECFGDGHGRLILGDTRDLSPAAVAIYSGIEVGKDGIKVRVAEQAKYRELLSRVVGLVDEDRDVNLSLRVSDAELDQLYEAAREQARRNKEAMLERAQRLADESASGGDE